MKFFLISVFKKALFWFKNNQRQILKKRSCFKKKVLPQKLAYFSVIISRFPVHFEGSSRGFMPRGSGYWLNFKCSCYTVCIKMLRWCHSVYVGYKMMTKSFGDGETGARLCVNAIYAPEKTKLPVLFSSFAQSGTNFLESFLFLWN